jgi:hypothetical protein
MANKVDTIRKYFPVRKTAGDGFAMDVQIRKSATGWYTINNLVSGTPEQVAAGGNPLLIMAMQLAQALNHFNRETQNG